MAELDPQKIYVENVRSVLGVSARSAVAVCEAAVRQGIFERWVEVGLPNGTGGACAPDESHLPASIHCHEMMDDGFFEERDYATRELPRTTFYRLRQNVEAEFGMRA